MADATPDHATLQDPSSSHRHSRRAIRTPPFAGNDLSANPACLKTDQPNTLRSGQSDQYHHPVHGGGRDRPVRPVPRMRRTQAGGASAVCVGPAAAAKATASCCAATSQKRFPRQVYFT